MNSKNKFTNVSQLLASVILLCVTSQSSAVILLNDGAVNIINSPQPVGETVEVRDSPANMPTTANLVVGGSIAEGFDVYDFSIINMDAGPVGISVGTSIDGHDNSTVNILSGRVGDGVRAFNNSEFNISGGEIGSEDSFFNDMSSLFFSGGDGEGFIFNDGATGEITGGRLEAIFGNDLSDVLVTAGEIWDGLVSSESAEITIEGGDISPEGIEARDNSNIEILGGMFDLVGETLSSQDMAVIDIYGLAFNRPFGAIADANGLITGTLLDGSAFSADFTRDRTASIILHGPLPVPEPSTLGLIGLAGLISMRKKRPRSA